MNAKGLMVGNYLKKDGVVVKIDARSIFDMFYENEQYKPIQLTEEWLVKFGFEVGTDLFQDFKEYEKLFDTGKSITLSHEFECYNGIYSQRLNYVHQLQNLFFALTGVELQLSST